MTTKLMICTHGDFGEALKKSAEMIVGEMADVLCFSLLPGMPPETFSELIQRELSTEDEYLCLVDLFGGTPCLTVSRLIKAYPLVVVTGVNLGMLLEVYMKLGQVDVAELSVVAMETLEASGRIISMSTLIELAKGGS